MTFFFYQDCQDRETESFSKVLKFRACSSNFLDYKGYRPEYCRKMIKLSVFEKKKITNYQNWARLKPKIFKIIYYFNNYL